MDNVKNNIGDFLVRFNDYSAGRLIAHWIWLLDDDKTPILVSAMGDMFLRDQQNNIFFLNVGMGRINLVANRMKEFERKLTDINQVNEWLMIELFEDLKNSGQDLNNDQVYSYKKLPVLGGDYSPSNFRVTDIETHFSFAGQIHEQLKDLPPGTESVASLFNKSDL